MKMSARSLGFVGLLFVSLMGLGQILKAQPFGYEHDYPIPADQLWEVVSNQPESFLNEYFAEMEYDHIQLDPLHKTLKVQFAKLDHISFVAEETYILLKVLPLNNNSSVLNAYWVYQTTPDFMRKIVKPVLQNQLKSFLIQLEEDARCLDLQNQPHTRHPIVAFK